MSNREVGADGHLCHWCGQSFVVPSLARDHESKCWSRPA